MVSDPNVVIETAKAIQESAKLGGQVVDAGKDVGTFFNRVFGSAVEDTVGLLWGDKIKQKRIERAIFDWGRLVDLAQKTNQRLVDQGVAKLRVVPPKVALPLIEYATFEHEEDLHTLWANLLATGLNAEADEIHRKYVTTLAEMTSEDANVLGSMFREAELKFAKEEIRDSTVVYGPGVDGTFSYNEIAVISLNRLGLIHPAYIKFKTFVPGGHDDRYGDYDPIQDDVSVPGNLNSVTITEFGIAFGHAVGIGAK